MLDQETEEHYLCLMLLALLIFVTFMLNKTQFAQSYSTLLLTPACIGAVIALYFLIYDPISEKQYDIIEHDYFLVVKHILLPFVLFQSLLVLNGDDLFGELGAISLFGLLGPIITIVGFKMMTHLDINIDMKIAALVGISEVFSRIQDLNIFFIDYHIKVLIIGEAALSSLVPSILISNNFQLSQIPLDLTYSLILGYTICYLFGQMLKLKTEKSFCQFEIFTILFNPWITYVISRAMHINSVAGLIICSFSFIKNVLPELSEAGRQLLYTYYGFMTNVAQTAFYVMFGMFAVYNQSKLMPYLTNSIFILIAHLMIRSIFTAILSSIINRICKDELFTPQSRNYVAFTAQYGLVGFALCTTRENIYQFSCLIAINLWIVNVSRIYFLHKNQPSNPNIIFRMLRKIQSQFDRFKRCEQNLANENSSLNFVPLMKLAQQQ